MILEQKDRPLLPEGTGLGKSRLVGRDLLQRTDHRFVRGVSQALLGHFERNFEMEHAVRKPSHKLTFEEAVQVHLMIWGGELQSRIAAFFDTNSGRISEVNTGKRHPGSREEAVRRFRSAA